MQVGLPKRFIPYEIDGRSGDQWNRSIIAYLEHRAGIPWRNLSRPEHRNAPEYLSYVEAIRLVTRVRYAPERVQVEAAPATDTRLAVLVRTPRRDLVDALMGIEPKFTDKRLLSHFTKAKLAGMLISRRDALPRVLERTA